MTLIEWISAGLVLLLLVASIVLYFLFQKTYFKYRIFMRKLYYSVILITGFIAYAMGDFPVTTPAGLGILVVLVVFVDLAIFQTPDITKFMNQEFKHEEIENTVDENASLVALQAEKLTVVNSVLRTMKEEWVTDNPNPTYEEYEEFVRTYLQMYATQYGMKLFSYYVPASDGVNSYQQQLDKTYTKIRERFDFNIRAVGFRKAPLVKRLENGNSIIILEKDCSYALVPFTPKYFPHNFLFVITSEDGGKLNETDAALVTNMLIMMEMWWENQQLYLDDDAYDGEDADAEPVAESQASDSP